MASLDRISEEVTIHHAIDMFRSSHAFTTMVSILSVVGTLGISACAATESTTSAPPPGTSSSTTTVARSASTTPAHATERTLEVPSHTPPIIDGVLDADEWAGSATVTMTDGSSLHWMHDENTLYMALESDAMGAVNLLISNAEETWILHSSAALGSALYLAGDGVWELSHGYDWCCRSVTNDSARLKLLDEEGWQANIGYTGDDGIVEYEVALPWKDAAVAVSYLTDSETSAFSPEDLSFEARDQLVGPPPPERDFNLDEWYTLVIVDG